MVQIRDLETHMPVNGVKVGDIGMKLGYNSKDNGWLIFNFKMCKYFINFLIDLSES